jgi:Peptidase family M50
MFTKSKKSILPFIVLLGFGIFGYLVGKYGLTLMPGLRISTLPASAIIAVPLLFIVSFFLVITIHEGGHALVGVWMKFDFRMYVVGPFMWEKEQSIWKFKWNRNVNTMGGMVLCLPTGNDNLINRFSYFAAGGPLASILLALVFYGLYLFISPFGLDGTGFVLMRILFIMIGSLSLMIFIVTALPMRMGGFYTDGARFLRLRKGDETSQFELLTLKIITSSSNGTRPKMLDKSDLNEALRLANQLKEPFGVYLLSYFHQVSFDEGDIEIAEKYLEQYISQSDEIPNGIRNVVWLDAAFFYAFAKNDLERATSFMTQFKPSSIIPKAQINATEAAISYLKSEMDVTKQKVSAAINELPNMYDKGVAVALGEKLNALKYKING